MQEDHHRSLLMAARAEYGDIPRLKPIDDFGFYYGRQIAEKWFMMLKHYHILPGAGGWEDQDFRVQHDIELVMAKYGEALEQVRPQDFNGPQS